MHIKAYTPETICQCLGLVGFEVDPGLSKAGEAMRLLLMPSFHPEVCITIADGRVSVVAARSMIWRQSDPAPMFAYKDEGEITAESFSRLIAAFAEVADVTKASGLAIDGMPVDFLLLQRGSPLQRVQHNVGRQSRFATFAAQVVSAAWNSLQNVYCRNALAKAAKYGGLELPLIPEPPRKPTIGTLVLGPEEDRAQLLEALRKHHAD
jgi:hypothetical protein